MEKYKMCNILKTADLIVERNRGKLGLAVRKKCIPVCSVLLISDSSSSLWIHSVRFAKFPMLRFSKGYCGHNFSRFQLNFMLNMLVIGGYRLLLFGKNYFCQKFKKVCTLNFAFTQDHMRVS